MFAKLITTGIEGLEPGFDCFANGPMPAKGNCVSNGWSPRIGQCMDGGLVPP